MGGVVSGPDPDEVVDALRRAVAEEDPPPDHVVALAKAVYSMRSLDAELAQLVFDSAVDEELVGVRGGGGRQLTFRTVSLTIELDVSPNDGRVVGLVAPGRGAEVELRHHRGTATTTADDLGRFTISEELRGPISIRCRVDTPGGPVTAQTEWTTV